VKKLVLGCGLSLVILGVGASVAAYYFVYRPARMFVTSLTDLGSMPELERALTNTAPYTPPAAATLTAAQVQRFMEAQGAVKTRLGSRFAELDAKYKALDQQTRGGRSLGITELVGAYQDLFGLIADARRAQIEALNAQGFSKLEYDWVRLRVYEAAGLQFTGVDLNELIGQVKGGTLQLPAQDVAKLEQTARSVPAENQTLVKPHLDALKEWIPYAIFGL
jgi:hypothetical protein